MEKNNKGNKTLALIACGLAYVAALVICFLIYPSVAHLHPLLVAAILDGIATIFIFIISVAFNNSSFYDPYWSVAPIPILYFWVAQSDPGHINPVRQYLILGLVIIWAVRLTWNWGRRWNGFKDEDWRYAGFREKLGNFYWVIGFFGIHFFPTLLVFLGCISVFPALTNASGPISAFDVVAGLITIHAIILETAADQQLRRFIKSNPRPGTFLQSGLWKYSRHPNYLGEVMFWVGLFIFSLGSHPFQWWYMAGPLVMILLFRLISVPMIDKRMSGKKKDYSSYMAATSALLLWPPKKYRDNIR
jgi:steroid 5-alpha reductase family enzyme